MKMILLPGVGEKFNIPLPAMVADHGKARHAERAAVIIQNVCKSPVHLERLSGVSRVTAPTVSLRRCLLPLCRNEILMCGDIFLNNGRTALESRLPQSFQNDGGVLDSLSQHVVNDAGVAAELGDCMFAPFCGAGKVLKSVSLEAAELPA